MDLWALKVAPKVKNPLANAGDARDTVSSPGSGIFLGAGNGNSLQYSGLENSMDRGVQGSTSTWGCNESDTPSN